MEYWGKQAIFRGNPMIYTSFPYFPNHESNRKHENKYTLQHSKRQPKHRPKSCISEFSHNYISALETQLGLFTDLNFLHWNITEPLSGLRHLSSNVRSIYLRKMQHLFEKSRKSIETWRSHASQPQRKSDWRIRPAELQSKRIRLWGVAIGETFRTYRYPTPEIRKLKACTRYSDSVRRRWWNTSLHN